MFVGQFANLVADDREHIDIDFPRRFRLSTGDKGICADEILPRSSLAAMREAAGR